MSVAPLRVPPAYAPPTAPYPIDLRLDANEGRPAPAAQLESAARNALDDAHRYPSTERLARVLGARLSLSPESIAIGAGGDDILFRICRAFLGAGRAAIVTTPTFEMIPREARAVGSDVLEIPWWDGPFPTREVISRIYDRTGVVFAVTPNNPTGNVATAADLRALSSAAPRALLCVDLAYTEYAEEDLTSAALELPNVLVVRTLSKAWGLAGLRVGYGLGPAELIRAVRACGGPYPVSSVSLGIASEWVRRGEAYMRETVRITSEERGALACRLREFGVNALDSQANFVLARFASPWAAWCVADALARDHAIGVRRFPPGGTLGNALRITCPCDPALFQRLCDALSAILGGTP